MEGSGFNCMQIQEVQLSKNAQTYHWDHPNSRSMDTGIFAHEYIGRGMKLLRLLLGTRLRMTGAITLFLAHAFVAWIGTISYFYLYL